MDVPMIPNVLMLDAGENLDDKLFVRGDLLDALSVDIYFKDVKSKLLTVFDVVTTKLRNHISDTYCHTNPAEKRYWNNKLDKATFDEAFSVLKARLDGWEGRLEDIERTIGNLPDFDTFALKTDIEGVYVSYDDLEDALDALNIPTQEDLEDFVKQSDLEGYLKEGDILGTINGQVFHQGDSITVEGGGGGEGGEGLPYKVTSLSVSSNILTLQQENNPNSPFRVTLPSGGGGSSYVLPAATTQALGGIKLGYNESQDNYAVQLNGNSQAFVHVPLSSSGGGGGGEVTAGYYETIFTTSSGDSTPDTPQNNITPSDSYTSISGTYTWTHSAANSDGTVKVWMASRWNSSSTVGGSWSGAWLITGPEGDAGADGISYEYVYTRTTREGNWESVGIQDPNYDSASYSFQEDDFVPTGWTDNPSGVDSTYRFEWVAIRYKDGGVWSLFSTPTIWSAYGRNGTDGDGVEYIFYKDDSGTKTFSNSEPLTYPPAWTNDANFQQREYVRANSGWTDDPQTLTVQGSKQYVSMRKKQDGVWQAYSEPALWSYYAKDGRDGEGGEVQYLEYPVLRLRGTWQSGVPNPAYNDGTVEEDHVMYIDVVEYNGIFWKCIKHHSDSHTPADGSEFWSPFSVYGDAAFDAIIANYLYAHSIAADQLVIYDSNNNISAGMSGADATIGNSNIRIWAGAARNGNIADAPFTVDSNGKLKATEAEISGTVTADVMYSSSYVIPSNLTSYTVFETILSGQTSPIKANVYVCRPSTNLAVTLPDSSEYEGLELRFLCTTPSNTQYSLTINSQNSENIHFTDIDGYGWATIVDSVLVKYDCMVIIQCIDGGWYIHQGQVTYYNN